MGVIGSGLGTSTGVRCLLPGTSSPTHPDPAQEKGVGKESLSSTSGSESLGVSLSGLLPGPKGHFRALGYLFTRVFTTRVSAGH